MMIFRQAVFAFVVLLLAGCAGEPVPMATIDEGPADDLRALEFAAAMSAHHLCSGMWVVGRDYQRTSDEVIDQDMRPFWNLGWRDGFEYKVDVVAKTATISGLGVPARTAKYHGDQGCTILPAGQTDVYFEPVAVPRGLLDASTTDWPMGDANALDDFEDVDRVKMESALDWALEQPHNTRSVVVVYNGKIIGERYAPGFTKDTPQISWSEGKSLTATLIGRLVHEGYLDIEDPAPVPSWHEGEDPRSQIMIKDLLRMSSGLDVVNLGLDDQASWGEANEHMRVYFDSIDVYDHMLSQPAGIPPATQWRYRNSDPLTLAWTVKQIAEENGENFLIFPQKLLFDRLGMRSVVLEPDAWGNLILSGYDYVSARDWARFGLLYLQDGIWMGERLLPEGWTKFVSTPAPGEGGDGYGGLFWLNRGSARDKLPADAYWASGLMGQTTMIIPSRAMVIVRQGPSPGGTGAYINEAFARILNSVGG